MQIHETALSREELEFVLDWNHYLKGGTKEACVKARQFLNTVINPGNQLHSPLSCVSADEFVEAVKVLMAFAFSQEDTVPERWNCDNDCERAADYLCPGECNIDKKAKKQCPYFADEANK